MKIQKRIALFLSVMLIALSVLTGCGGKKQEAAPEKAASEKAVPETTSAFQANAGTYELFSLLGLSLADYAMMSGTTEEEAKKSFYVELKEDQTAVFNMDGEPENVKWKLDGENISLYADGEAETLEGTLKDGVLTLTIEDTDVILLREGAVPPEIETSGLAALLGEAEENADSGSGVTEASAETTAAETKAEETTAAETSAAETSAEETSAAETTAAETKAAETAAAAGSSKGSEGARKYALWEYSANGMTVHHDMLVTAGMGDTYIELRDDHSGTFLLFNTPVEVTWNDKEVLMYGVSKYPYTISGDTLTLDMQGVTYVMKRDDSAGSSSGSSSADTETEAPETEAETKAGAGSAASSAGAAASDASGGDGIVSEEAVQKGYVWLNEIQSSKAFDMTYEDLAEYFGTEGQFDKEEYSDHMKRNKRFYKWVSADDPNHFIYVNFDEKDAEKAPGVYTISSFNSSGFRASEAKDKYLSVLQEEAREAEKAAAANAPMKKETLTLKTFGGSDTLDVEVEYPEKGWARKDGSSDVKLYNTEDLNKTFGAGFIQFTFKKNVEDFDFYKDKFENFKEIGTREIGGIEMTGRTYKNIGYEWTEYVGQIRDGAALSIGAVKVDLDEGTFGDRILNSIEIK